MISLLLANWKWIAMAALCVVIGFLYVDVQHQETLVAKARLEKSQLEEGYAKAVQNATTEAEQKLQVETHRGNALATQLVKTRADLDKARADLSGRIDHVASAVPAACVFGPDFVLYWNDAFGAAAPGMPALRGPGGTSAAPGTPGTAGSGVQTGIVTPADLLANLRDNGSRCQKIEAQLVKLIELEEGRP